MVAELSARLPGALVTLEPLRGEHEAELLAAAGDPEVWRWMVENAIESPATFHRWIESSLAARREGREAPFAVVANASGEAIGSTRYMEIRLEHGRVEIDTDHLHAPAGELHGDPAGSAAGVEHGAWCQSVDEGGFAVDVDALPLQLLEPGVVVVAPPAVGPEPPVPLVGAAHAALLPGRACGGGRHPHSAVGSNWGV